MQKKVIKGLAVLAALAAMSATTLPAQAAGKPIKAGLKIAIMPKSINNGYFTAWNQGAQKACKEIKATCTYLGPTEATGPAQVQFINQVIQKKFNALVISAADQNAIVPALRKAQAKGIKIVTSDADVTTAAARTVAVLPAESTRIGTAEVDWIAQATGSKGKIAVLSAAATAANQNAWIKAMGSYLTTKYPNMSWAGGSVEKATYYGDDNPEKSATVFAQILTEHPDIAGIIAPTTVGVLAAAQEKKKKGAAVKVTGLGLPSQMAPYIEDGTVEKVGLWNPIDLGYVAVYAAARAVTGEFKGKVGSSFSAGTKTYKVVPGGIAYLGDPFTFTKENIATFKKIY